MPNKAGFGLLLLGTMLASGQAKAQVLDPPVDGPSSAAQGQQTMGDAATPPSAESAMSPNASDSTAVIAAPVFHGVPAGTIIIIRVAASVSSSTAIQRDFFPIELVEPIMLGDREIVPAGIRGEGQVVHARHRGWGGGAGELILAARYLQWGERRLGLRGMHLGVAGRDGSGTALAVTAGIGVLGSLVTGRSANVVEGTQATARIAEPIAVDPVAAPIPSPVDGVTAPAGQTTTRPIAPEAPPASVARTGE